MRTSLSILFTILLSVMISQEGKTQVDVSWGALHTHSVDFVTEYGEEEGAVYHWLASGGTQTDLSNVSASSVDIIWDGDPGEHELSVYAVDGNGCQSETITQKVFVQQESTLLFDDPDNTALCAVLDDGMPSGLSQITFTIGFNNGIAPYSLVYRIVDNQNNQYDNNGNPTTANITVEVVTDTSYDIIIENGFLNDTDQDQEYKVEILEAKTSDGANISLDQSVRTFVIRKMPMIKNLRMH